MILTTVCGYLIEKELVRKFGSYGTGKGKLNRPLGIAFDANNHLYVSEIINHRVQNFNIYGTYLLKFGTKGSSVGRLMNPLGIVVHDDKLYIAEWGKFDFSIPVRWSIQSHYWVRSFEVSSLYCSQ